MEYRQQSPSPRIAGIVKCFWALSGDAGENGDFEPVLPDGCPEIVFNFADRFEKLDLNGRSERQASVVVSGQLRRHILIRPTGRVDIFGVRFKPHAAGAFLGIPVSELTDEVIPLDLLMKTAEFEDLVNGARSFEEKINVFESQLVSRLEKAPGRYDEAARIAEVIIKSCGTSSVVDVRNMFGLGERQIQRIFGAYVGVSPKMFSRIVRFQSVVKHIERSNRFDLLDRALDLGYYDQSHMIRDFREFAGKSPKSYFDDAHRISEFFTATD